MNDDILARLERIESRLDALEARPAPTYRQAVPPVYRTPEPPPAPPPQQDDLESLIGSRWLPRAGALAIVAALAYLVALGLQRGLITPAMVVVGIAAVCIGVVGLGLRLKDEREAFGHVLVGLGAGGLYVDAVGAHLYQNVIGSEAMVAACLAVSLLSLGYGFWRALPSFLGIGLAGGLLAALMPLSKGGTATSAGLLLLVAPPAFATAARRGWSGAIVATWAACFLASLGVLASDGSLAVRLLPLDALLIVALAGWALADEGPSKGDPAGAFPFVAAQLTGGAALLAFRGVAGLGHLVALGLLAVGIGGVLRSRRTGVSVTHAGLVLALVPGPLGLEPAPATLLLGLLALAVAILAARERASRPLAGVLACLALLTYGYTVAERDLAHLHESLLIGLMILAAVATAWVLDLREARVAAGVVVWSLFTRLAYFGLDLPHNAATTVAWIAVLAGLLVVGFLRKRPELRQLGLAVAVATAAKVVLVDLAGLDAALKAAVLLGLGLVLLGGGYAYVRAKGNLPG